MNECMHESMIGRANEETDRKNEWTEQTKNTRPGRLTAAVTD